MTEEEFRARFDADRRAGRLTWIYDKATTASCIALALDGPETIIGRDHRGQIRCAMATSRFIDEAR